MLIVRNCEVYNLEDFTKIGIKEYTEYKDNKCKIPDKTS